MTQRFHRLFETTDVAVGERFELSAANARIVRSVLRLSRGDAIGLLDGRGGVAAAELAEVGRSRVVATLLQRKTVSPAWPAITLLQGLPKGEKAGWIVQKGAELGVGRILFFESGRTIAKRNESQTARWTRVAIEALRQSGNAHLPELIGPCPLSEALRLSGSAKRSLFLDETEKSRRLRDLFGSDTSASISVAVGPEGGWSGEDRRELSDHGFTPVGISPFTLRTETAAVAALAALRAWFP